MGGWEEKHEKVEWKIGRRQSIQYNNNFYKKIQIGNASMGGWEYKEVKYLVEQIL